MTKSKNKEKTEIRGISKGLENNLVVQKSRPLLALWKSEFSLAEFKILDAYLARIDSRNPERQTVVFERGEIERLVGVKKINKEDLSSRLKNLYKPIDLHKGSSRKAKLVGLFDEADAEKDENDVWQVKLTCTTAAKKYIFNIEDLGYLRYKLRCITCLTSRYSYVLFQYLEDNRFRKTWIVDIDDLRNILNCENDPLYDEYKYFNQRVLKKCHKELTEKTECRFTYESVRSGQKAKSIRFTLETLADIDSDSKKEELYEVDGEILEQTLIDVDYDEDDGSAPPDPEDNYKDERLGFLAGACKYEFDEDEMRVISDTLSRVVIKKTQNSVDINLDRYKVLAACYHRLELRARRTDLKPVSNRVSYLVNLIEKQKKDE